MVLSIPLVLFFLAFVLTALTGMRPSWQMPLWMPLVLVEIGLIVLVWGKAG
jgi:hypothetical protein